MARKDDATNVKDDPGKQSSAPRWSKPGRTNGYQSQDGRQLVKIESEKTKQERSNRDLKNLIVTRRGSMHFSIQRMHISARTADDRRYPQCRH